MIDIPTKRLGHGSNIITADFDIQILSSSKLWTSSLQIPQFDSSEHSRYQQPVSSYGNLGLCYEGLANSPGRFNVTLGFANRVWYHIYHLGWASTKKEIWWVMWEKTGTALALAKPSLWSGRTRPQYNCEYFDPSSTGLKRSLHAAAAFVVSLNIQSALLGPLECICPRPLLGPLTTFAWRNSSLRSSSTLPHLPRCKWISRAAHTLSAETYTQLKPHPFSLVSCCD